ncbi:MAG: recombination mediator RecR [Spirochaetota bacterium]|nr:recombination mediator RecR [Spirochaetota bacterium]
MSHYTASLERVISEFSRFPGVGAKSAEKLAFFVLKRDKKDVELLCDALLELKEKTRFCEVCFSLTEKRICAICEGSNRNHRQICVVEQFKDVISIEKTLEYKGLYHVLNGHISPIDGLGPEDLTISELMGRVEESDVEEVILACNPNVEGDATSLFIAEKLKNLTVRVTRIARGLPVGGDLEFADPLTLTRSLERREELSL